MNKKTDWTPTSSGIMPPRNLVVQVTYIGYFDKLPHCDAFAYYNGNRWVWKDEEGDVIVPITAWRHVTKPYRGN